MSAHTPHQLVEGGMVGIRFEDGRLAAQGRHTVLVPVAVYGWPLPERLGVLSHLEADQVAIWDADDVAGAHLPPEITESPNVVTYHKVAESQLPEEPGKLLSRHILKGATYEQETP